MAVLLRGDMDALPVHEDTGLPGIHADSTDEEILAAYHLVARTEGVFVEPASAASIAGLLKSIEDGWVSKGSTVVCTVTGSTHAGNASMGVPN